jgi:radical SAM protein with 4Fe4S-binding SPASM domain
MSPEQVVRLTRFALAHTCWPHLDVELSGGETLLLGPGWLRTCLEGIRAVHSNGRSVRKIVLTTNAVLLTEEIADILCEARVGVCVSLDTCEELAEGYKRVCPEVLSGIRLLQERGLSPAVNAVGTKRAVSGSAALMRFLATIGVAQFRVTLLRPLGLAKAHMEELRPDTRDVLRSTVEALDYMRESGLAVIETNVMERVFRYFADSYVHDFCNTLSCPAGREFLAVDARGDVYPCGADLRKRSRLGNIYQGFDERQRERVLSRYHAKGPHFLRCFACKARRICFFSCSACEYDGALDFFESQCQACQALFEYFEQNEDLVAAVYRAATERNPGRSTRRASASHGTPAQEELAREDRHHDS